MARAEVREPQSLDELTALFADAGDEPIAGTYDGVRFDLLQAADGALRLALIAGPLGLDDGHHVLRGLAVRVRLPLPVPADMQLLVGKVLGRESTRLEVGWNLEASDPAAVRAYLADGLEPVLRRLGERQGVRMDDRELVWGPLLGTPAESARDLADVVAALPRPTGDEAELPDFDAAAEADGGVVEAGVYDGEIDAELARGALEAAGIPARTVGGGTGLWGGATGLVDVRVLVPRSYAEQAEAVLAELDAADDEDEDEDDEDEDEPEQPAGTEASPAHERRYAGTADRLRRPERLELLEVERTVTLCLDGLDRPTVLDVGTGSGLFAEAFAARGLTVAGCDVNEELLAAARAAVPRAEFATGAAEELPYDDASSDLVFLGHVLHEVDDLNRALAEARRVARARVAVLEWPYRREEQGPPLEHRLRPEAVEAEARKAGFAKVERLELRYMVLFRLER
jgi:SAM-dependent methyltransferase